MTRSEDTKFKSVDARGECTWVANEDDRGGPGSQLLVSKAKFTNLCNSFQSGEGVKNTVGSLQRVRDQGSISVAPTKTTNTATNLGRGKYLQHALTRTERGHTQP